MATYIIGDLQGCHLELLHLLDHIRYDPTVDQLGFVGDLVNRGPESLAVLRFLKTLQPTPWIVLGNHDFYLLILGYGLVPEDRYNHTLHEVLTAPDREEILLWLRHQSLVFQPVTQPSLWMVHAGIPPQWTLQQALLCSREVEIELQGPGYLTFLGQLFGDEPTQWDNSLEGIARQRYIVNAFTRLRFCKADGELDFHSNGSETLDSKVFRPWFHWRDPAQDASQIAFGHWAALSGECHVQHIHALDTGCVWGHRLTAWRVDDNRRFFVPARR